MNLKKKTKVKDKAFIKIVEVEIIFLRNVINHLHNVVMKMGQLNQINRTDKITVVSSIVKLIDVSKQTERTLVTYLDHYKF